MDIATPPHLEKMILAKRAGKFLCGEEATDQTKKEAVLTIIRKLASDINAQVRETLAFELRLSNDIPSDIAEKIACDIESVATPFLAHTNSLNTKQLISLLPKMNNSAHITLAKRNDLNPELAHALILNSQVSAVTYVIRNSYVTLLEKTYQSVIKRYNADKKIMDFLSQRADLPLSIEKEIIDFVSESYREILMERHKIDKASANELTQSTNNNVLWKRVSQSSPQQIHGLVKDLKAQKRLSHALILEMSDRGSHAFLESTMALYWGRTLSEVRETLNQKDQTAFKNYMRKSNISEKTVQLYAKVAHKLYLS